MEEFWKDPEWIAKHHIYKVKFLARFKALRDPQINAIMRARLAVSRIKPEELPDDVPSERMKGRAEGLKLAVQHLAELENQLIEQFVEAAADESSRRGEA